jgi:hypothetical protein
VRINQQVNTYTGLALLKDIDNHEETAAIHEYLQSIVMDEPVFSKLDRQRTSWVCGWGILAIDDTALASTREHPSIEDVIVNNPLMDT